MKDLNYYAELDEILLDETNIKKLVRNLGNTEKGKLELCIDKGSKEYYLLLGDKLIDMSDNLKKVVLKVLGEVSNK